MIATSTVVMFFLMYQAVYSLDHSLFSETRMWSSVVMGAVMALIMLGFMWSMYRGNATKMAVIAGMMVVGAAALWLVRSQETIDDVAYMKAMIPLHSIAILTSRRAQIHDPRVRRLADGIIEAQVKEIAEMKMLIDDIDRNGLRNSTKLPGRSAAMTPAMAAEAQTAVR
ncbi:MAG: DUF305 domain-containing protein [Pseudomonadota bacterium]|nr:DUF305 domain-containing protein [Pseudomonadota bacterium]